MTIQLGVVMDPIQTSKYHKDSTLAMLLAASRRGWGLWYMEQGDLSLDNGNAIARMRPLQVQADPDNFYHLGEPEIRPLTDLNTVY